MGTNLRPVSGVQINVLQRAITALRVALRHRRGVIDLRPVQLRITPQADFGELGDRLIISPEAMTLFRASEAARNDITPQAGQPGGFDEPDRQLRPWPFRWPSQDLPALAPYPMPEPLPVPGQYLDILF